MNGGTVDGHVYNFEEQDDRLTVFRKIKFDFEKQNRISLEKYI